MHPSQLTDTWMVPTVLMRSAVIVVRQTIMYIYIYTYILYVSAFSSVFYNYIAQLCPSVV